MKQNAASAMTVPTPILACQLRAKAVRMSRPDPCSANESSPAPGAAMPGAPVPRSAADIADPRVKHRVGDVGEQAADDGGHPDDQRGAKQDREVMMRRGVEEQQS